MRCLVALATFVPLVACEDATAVRVPFVVPVDSVELPATIGSTEPLPVRLLGIVGPNGCHRLTGVRRDRIPPVVRLEVHGEVLVGEGFGCTGAVIPLDTTLVVLPPHGDSAVIRVVQPEGPPIVRVVGTS